MPTRPPPPFQHPPMPIQLNQHLTLIIPLMFSKSPNSRVLAMFRVSFRNNVSSGTSSSKRRRSYTTLDLGDTITRQIDGSSFRSRDISRECLTYSFSSIFPPPSSFFVHRF